MRRARWSSRNSDGRSSDDLRLFRIERDFAAPAIVIVGSELDELTAITTNDFPGVNWGKGRSHSELADVAARAWLLASDGPPDAARTCLVSEEARCTLARAAITMCGRLGSLSSR